MTFTGCSHQDRCSDLELINLVRDGDPDAFCALLDRYMPAVRAGAYRYSGVNGADMEDFIQEAMITLYRAAKSYDAKAGARFSTYAITCINNAVASAMKRHLKNSRKGMDFNLDEIDEDKLMSMISSGSFRYPVEDQFLDREAERFRAAQIDTLLSDFERRVLKLYLGGHTYQRISQILDTSTKAVDNALQRVRRKLRSEF